jgi:metal-sulfur cluster biosynthetic enzyme
MEIPGDTTAEKRESESLMSPEMIRKIDAVLEKIKDPESGLPVAQLGLVRRVRYSEKDKRLYIFKTIIATIIRDVTAEFQKEFPDLTVEFV